MYTGSLVMLVAVGASDAPVSSTSIPALRLKARCIDIEWVLDSVDSVEAVDADEGRRSSTNECVSGEAAP